MYLWCFVFCEPIYLSCSDQPQEVYEELPEQPCSNQKEELDIYEEMECGSQLEEPRENLPCSNQPEELYENLPCSNQPEELYEDLPCSNQQEEYHEAFNKPEELYEDLVSLLLQYLNSQLSAHILDFVSYYLTLFMFASHCSYHLAQFTVHCKYGKLVLQTSMHMYVHSHFSLV